MPNAFEFEDLRPGQEYALVGHTNDGQLITLFAGVACYVTDDFLAMGIITERLQQGLDMGIVVNENDSPTFMNDVREGWL